MKYLELDQESLKIIDSFFNSRFAYLQLNDIPIIMHNIFPWNHDFNSEDIQIMYEDLQSELYLENYIPKLYLVSPIKFLNYVMKHIPNLRHYYLKPYTTRGFFRSFFLVDR